GVSDRTVFLGALDHRDIPTAIAAFDVALAPYPDLPHDFYYSPLKLFEYLACGTPTVASAVGQIAELITSGEHALLTAPGDLDAIAAACSRLLADPVLASRLGRAGTELVHGRFTWDRNAAEVMAWCSLVG
ncbi:MAG: glycosyltransferase, partial [Actinomycetota bacterium]